MAKMLTVKLTQQTPMIHFQFAEPRAVIRGSELKPKLDRFLIEQMGGLNKAVLDHGDWFIQDHVFTLFRKSLEENPHAQCGGRLALDYKVRITTGGEPEISLEIGKSFFGYTQEDRQELRNHGSNISIKTVEYRPDRVFLTVCSRHDSLIEYVSEEHSKRLELFFLLNNFGTRQTKGFGSFTVGGRGFHPKPDDLIREYYQQFMKGLQAYELTPNNARGDPLQWIWVTYGLMKSGFNLPAGGNRRDYYKGFLLTYLYREGRTDRNDKAFIKQQLLADEYVPGIDRRGNGEEYVFVRALLGLATQSDWYSAGEGRSWRHGSPTVTVSAEDPEIARIPSPILFSVADEKRVFMLPRRIPSAVFSKDFSVTYKTRYPSPDPPRTKTISTPQQDDFELSAFLHDFAVRFNDKRTPWWEKEGQGEEERSLNQAQNIEISPAQTLKLDPL